VILGFPNPISWTIDKVTGFIGDAVADGFQALIGGLTAWVLDAVVWIVGGVFRFFLDATDPDVTADWFSAPGGPYATTASIAATLLVGFVLAGIVQGVLTGDVGGMVRRMALDLPVAVIGMVGLVSVTQLLVRVTDELSSGILEQFGADVGEFTAVVGSLSALTGGTATAFVIFVLGLVSVLAGIVLVTELVIRAALVYIVVALAPLVFAAQLWPAVRGAGRRAIELLVALVLSKLVIAVALAVASAALVGAGTGGATSLAAPETVTGDPSGSVTQAVGILLAAVAAFGVAAFSPLMVVRLLPVTEAAVVAQGLRGGPVRSAEHGMLLAHHARTMHTHRLTAVASSGAGGGTAAAGAGAAHPAAAAAIAAGTVARGRPERHAPPPGPDEERR
jgi:hypothetical protein